MPNGNQFDFEIVRHAPCATVVPIDGDDLLMLWQYRPALGEWGWELPAGLIEKGETPLQCIRREMIEETGYRGKNFKKLITIANSAGFCDELIHFYKCDVGQFIGHAHESAEVIEVHRLPIKKVLKMIQQNKIRDVKTVIGLLYWQQFL